MGILILDILKISVDTKGCIKPSRTSAIMQRTIDYLFVFGQIIEILDIEFIANNSIIIII